MNTMPFRNSRSRLPIDGLPGVKASCSRSITHRIGDEAGDREALHQRRQHVLLAHHAAVEEREAGDRHHQHERRRRQHPRGVAAADLVGRDELRRVGAGGAAAGWLGRGAAARQRPRVPPPVRRGAGAEPVSAWASMVGATVAVAQGAGEFAACAGTAAASASAPNDASGASNRFMSVPLTARPRRFRRCGCARPVRGRRRRSCRRRSCRCWRPSRSLRSRARRARS